MTIKRSILKKTITFFITAVIMLIVAQSAFAGESESSGESHGGRGGHGGQGGGMAIENDEEVQAALDEAGEKFIQETFEAG